MKFSVLLPTKNGARFLRNCILSVLEQPYQDMELVVSDNASTDETPAIVKEFSHDPRLKYVRLDEPVPVTDNWNNALRASEGDYILIIGDDDCLMPSYFEKLEKAIDRHRQPDCITYDAYMYAFPGALDDKDCSYYSTPAGDVGIAPGSEGFIPAEVRVGFVKRMFRFKGGFPLNLQMTLVSRKMVGRFNGKIFLPPFPDHYAIYALLLNAERWAYLPDRLVVIGVSPKSFGHHFVSGRQDLGMDYLGSSCNIEGVIPGNVMINSMYCVLMLVEKNFQERLGGLRVSRAKYLGQHFFSWYLDWKFHKRSLAEVMRRFRSIPISDWWLFLKSLFDEDFSERLILVFRNKKPLKDTFQGLKPLTKVKDIREFVRWAGRQRAAHGP